MTDSDKTTAPVSNEELYVELRKHHRRNVAMAGLVPLTGSAILVGVTESVGLYSAILLGASLLCLGTATALQSGGWTRRALNIVPGFDVPESEETHEERLTGSARTDGGETERDES
jgi:hypothetical protein